jgi:hypothetical protein
VLGETAALPHTLEIGLHYQYLRSFEMYDGTTKIVDPRNRKTEWSQATLAVAYGIVPGLSFSALVPYTWKQKSECSQTTGLCNEWTSSGFGDVTCIVRYSPIVRSFVSFRELSVGLGVKLPIGSTTQRNDRNVRLSDELQPGTGSWDYNGSLSFYQGFELVDFVVSGVYVLTSEHERHEFGTDISYEFGDQFSYVLASNFHAGERLDISAALSGIVRGKDREQGEIVPATGRHQLWVVPGLKFQLIPGTLGLQVHYEHPIYQDFNAKQLGSDYNLRLSAVYTLPLKRFEENDS